jgi:hypothetical protein
MLSGEERMEDKESWRTGEGEDSVRRNKKEKTEHLGELESGWRAADREDVK